MQAWEIFLSDLEKKMGKQTVDTWLRPLKVAQYDACNLYLEAENDFQIAWFNEHVASFAKKNFLNNNSHLIKIHFRKSTSQKKEKIRDSYPPPIDFEFSRLDPNQTFSSFIFDDQSKLTIELCKKLTPGNYNPVFLFGPKGCGKSHLLMAIANRMQLLGKKVLLVHAEMFTEHVVKAIRSSQMQQFRAIYRTQDVLIIDDIHCLANRLATQEEFFHTFNTLYTEGKQIVLSSHLSPSQLEGIEPRLTSRFEWGIILELASLSKQKFIRVLKNKAHLHHFPLSDELANYLTDTFSSSTSASMRALEALMLRYQSTDPILLESAQTLLKDLVKVEEEKSITHEKIIQSTAAYFGIRYEDILGKSQAKDCSFPRKLAMYLCRKKMDLPFTTIGKVFRRDHSTVMASIRHIEDNSGEEEIEMALMEIMKSLNLSE